MNARRSTRMLPVMLLLVALAAALLSACSGDLTTPAPTTPAASPTPTGPTQVYPQTGLKAGVVASGTNPVQLKCAAKFAPVDFAIPQTKDYDIETISVSTPPPTAGSGTIYVVVKFYGPNAMMPDSMIVHVKNHPAGQPLDDQVVTRNDVMASTTSGGIEMNPTNFGGTITGLTFCAGGGA